MNVKGKECSAHFLSVTLARIILMGNQSCRLTSPTAPENHPIRTNQTVGILTIDIHPTCLTYGVYVCDKCELGLGLEGGTAGWERACLSAWLMWMWCIGTDHPAAEQPR